MKGDKETLNRNVIIITSSCVWALDWEPCNIMRVIHHRLCGYFFDTLQWIRIKEKWAGKINLIDIDHEHEPLQRRRART